MEQSGRVRGSLTPPHPARRRELGGSIPSLRITTMDNTYRVEAHDGSRWGFGIRRGSNSRLPEFCGLAFADQFRTRAEAFQLRDEAARLCGGSLRVASVKNA
jgi:hypothetical protein